MGPVLLTFRGAVPPTKEHFETLMQQLQDQPWVIWYDESFRLQMQKLRRYAPRRGQTWLREWRKKRPPSTDELLKSIEAGRFFSSSSFCLLLFFPLSFSSLFLVFLLFLFHTRDVWCRSLIDVALQQCQCQAWEARKEKAAELRDSAPLTAAGYRQAMRGEGFCAWLSRLIDSMGGKVLRLVQLRAFARWHLKELAPRSWETYFGEKGGRSWKSWEGGGL